MTAGGIGAFFGGLAQGLASGLQTGAAFAARRAEAERRRAEAQKLQMEQQFLQRRQQLSEALAQKLGSGGVLDPEELLGLASVTAVAEKPDAMPKIATALDQLRAARAQRAGVWMAAGAQMGNPDLVRQGLQQVLRSAGLTQEVVVRPAPEHGATQIVFVDPRTRQPTAQWVLPTEQLALAGAMLASDPSSLPNILRLPTQMEADRALTRQRLAEARLAAEKTLTEQQLRPLRLRKEEADIAAKLADANRATYEAQRFVDQRFLDYSKTLEEVLTATFGTSAQVSATVLADPESVAAPARAAAVAADLARDIASQWYLTTGELLPPNLAVNIASRVVMRPDDKDADQPVLVFGKDKDGRPHVRLQIGATVAPISPKMASFLKLYYGFRTVRKEDGKKPAETPQPLMRKEPASGRKKAAPAAKARETESEELATQEIPPEVLPLAQQAPEAPEPPPVRPRTDKPIMLVRRGNVWYMYLRTQNRWVIVPAAALPPKLLRDPSVEVVDVDQPSTGGHQ